MIAFGDFVDVEKAQVDITGARAGGAPSAGWKRGCALRRVQSKGKKLPRLSSGKHAARYHFTENRRIPPVILVADDGWFPRSRSITQNKVTHGFDPELVSLDGPCCPR